MLKAVPVDVLQLASEYVDTLVLLMVFEPVKSVTAIGMRGNVPVKKGLLVHADNAQMLVDTINTGPTSSLNLIFIVYFLVLDHPH